MIDFQEMDDAEILKIIQERQQASKNFLVKDPEVFRQKLEQIDAEYQHSLEKDYRYLSLRGELDRAQDTLETAKRRYAEAQHSLNPQIPWQMNKRLAWADHVKECEAALAEKQQELNGLLNTIAGERHARQLEAKRAEEEARGKELQAQEQMKRDAEIEHKLRAGWMGTEKEWQESYPRLRQQYLEQQALSNANTVSRLDAF